MTVEAVHDSDKDLGALRLGRSNDEDEQGGTTRPCEFHHDVGRCGGIETWKMCTMVGVAEFRQNGAFGQKNGRGPFEMVRAVVENGGDFGPLRVASSVGRYS